MPTISKAWCRRSFTVLAAAGVLAGWAQAQYTPPPPPLTTGPCVPTKRDPCPAPAPPPPREAFPFPGETPNSLPGAPGDNSATPAATSPAPPPASAPTPNSFPFPDEPDPASSSSSSFSSSSSSSSAGSAAPDPALRDRGSSGSTASARRHLPKVEDLDQRELKDLEVARFYASTGNHQAAYMRATDAVSIMPDDPEAHFLLAQNAETLGKTDQALAEYAVYLKLDPQGDKVLLTRKALARLASR